MCRRQVRMALMAAALVALGTGALAHGQEPVGVAEGLRRYGPMVELVLDNGDVIKGIYTETVEGRAMLQHPVLGSIGVPVLRISEVRPAGAVSAPAGEGDAGGGGDGEPVVQPGTSAAPQEGGAGDSPVVDDKAGFFERMRGKGWEGQLDLGIDGSEGNSETLNFRGAATAKHENDDRRLTLSALYMLKEADNEQTDNRFEAKARHDWLFKDSPWEWFVQGDAVIDRFKDYDWRWSVTTGPGYKFIDTEDTFLIGRGGLGVSQEVGADDDSVIPEAFVGYEFTHDLDERWSLATSGELFPSLDEAGEFRSAVRGGVEYKLAMETDLRLKAGVEHRYESDVDPGTEKSDIDYYISLVLGF